MRRRGWRSRIRRGTRSAAPRLAQRNLISGNTGEGIVFSGAGTTAAPGNNVVEGNFIGTDRGDDSLGNGLGGITLVDSAGNTIGGTAAGAGNLISGNGGAAQPGISLSGAGTRQNLVQGNLIGPDVTGTAALGGGITTSNGHGHQHQRRRREQHDRRPGGRRGQYHRVQRRRGHPDL